MSLEASNCRALFCNAQEVRLCVSVRYKPLTEFSVVQQRDTMKQALRALWVGGWGEWGIWTCPWRPFAFTKTNFISGCDSVSDVLLDPILQHTVTSAAGFTRTKDHWRSVFYKIIFYFIDSLGGIVPCITLVITAGTTSTHHNTTR